MRVCDKCGKKDYTIPSIFIWDKVSNDFLMNRLDLCVECNVELGKIIKEWLEEKGEIDG